jgi:hypothetical protein
MHRLEARATEVNPYDSSQIGQRSSIVRAQSCTVEPMTTEAHAAFGWPFRSVAALRTIVWIYCAPFMSPSTRITALLSSSVVSFQWTCCSFGRRDSGIRRTRRMRPRIIGQNLIAETQPAVEVLELLGFGRCRAGARGPEWLAGSIHRATRDSAVGDLVSPHHVGVARGSWGQGRDGPDHWRGGDHARPWYLRSRVRPDPDWNDHAPDWFAAPRDPARVSGGADRPHGHGLRRSPRSWKTCAFASGARSRLAAAST